VRQIINKHKRKPKTTAMSTWSSFFIRNTDKQKVIEKLKLLTCVNETYEGKITDDYYDSFLMDESLPNYLAVSDGQPNWIAININSPNKLIDWCTQFSKEFNTEVILILAQNTSDYYYFSYYNKGIKLREIECCYGGDIEEINFGEKFHFENEEPGTKTEYDGITEYFFDFECMEEYCKHFELALQYDCDKIIWTFLKSDSES
jgi:hypothetical protein